MSAGNTCQISNKSGTPKKRIATIIVIIMMIKKQVEEKSIKNK